MSELIESTHIIGEVVQNSDFLAKKPFETIPDFEPQPLTEFEKSLLKGTKNTEELLKEEAEEKEPEMSEEEKEKQRRKAYIDMLKVIALDKLDLPILTNPGCLPKRKKEKVMETMYSIMAELAEEEMKKEFQRVCHEKLFVDAVDYSQFPIYK